MSQKPTPTPAGDPLEDLHAALAPPGKPGAQPQHWALAGALFLLAGGAGLLMWRSLAPLPAPATQRQAPEPPGLIAAAPEAFTTPGGPSVAARQSLLAELSQAGNIFAPDRQPWPELTDAPTQQEQDQQVVTLGAAPDDEPPAVRQADGGLDLSTIRLTPVSNQLPPALFNEARAMKLEVLFGATASSAAQPDLGAAIRRGDVRGVYREGGEMPGEGGPWRILAIDLDNERVILSKQGHNIELRLRPRSGPAVVAAAPGAPAQRAGAREGAAEQPSVARATPESVRAQLRDAGLAAWEIEAILRLAQRPESAEVDGPAAQTTSAAAAGEEAGSVGQGAADKPAVKPPVVPAEIAALLRMMTSKQAPTVEPQPPQEEDDDEDSSDPDGGS